MALPPFHLAQLTVCVKCMTCFENIVLEVKQAIVHVHFHVVQKASFTLSSLHTTCNRQNAYLKFEHTSNHGMGSLLEYCIHIRAH